MIWDLYTAPLLPAVWNTIVQDALTFTQFQWQALATHERHMQGTLRAKFAAAQRKITEECDDLRNENKLLSEKSRRVILEMQKRDKYCKRLEVDLSSQSRDSQMALHQLELGAAQAPFANLVNVANLCHTAHPSVTRRRRESSKLREPLLFL